MEVNSKEVIDQSVFTRKVDSLLLDPKGNVMSQISDVCVNDKYIFVLDDMNGIFMFNANNGELKCSSRNTGHGKGECIGLKSLEMLNDTLYILDFQGQKIQKFDMEMKHVGDVQIEFPAIDFAVLNDGFLLYNMASTEKVKKVVKTSRDGKIIDSYLSPSKDMNLMINDKFFSRDENGNIYMSECFSDTIYKYKGGDLVPCFVLDTGENSSDFEHTSEMMNGVSTNIMGGSIITSQYVFTRFINEFVKNNIYTIDKNKSKSGLVKTEGDYIFEPMGIHRDYLYSVVNQVSVKDEGNKILLIKYHL